MKAKPDCSPHGYPPQGLLIIVLLIGEVFGLPAPSRAFALLVVSRRMRVLGKYLKGKCLLPAGQ